MSNTNINFNDVQAKITESALDHGVDALCAVGIVGSVYLDGATQTVVAGLVSIAIGKRVLNSKQ